MRKELIRALIATLFFGAAGGVFVATLNNYLADVHLIGAKGRGWLEFPRELPGFFIMFVVWAMLSKLRETQMATMAMLATMAGMLGLAWLAPNTAGLVFWIIVWSLGDHVIFAVEGPIGLKLARDGKEGKRLGQFGGARNLGTILGVGLIYLLAKIYGDNYKIFYTLGAGFALLAGFYYSRLKVGHADPPSRKIVFKKKYRIFYAISALFGIRKQIFLAFGAWVLVDIHGVPLSTIALLYFIASTLGVILRPLLGEIIDWLGERTVLAADELLIIMVCVAYAFASDMLAAPWDLYLLYSAYILDSILFALRIARTTYLKKIADSPEDITPTVSMGITIDHAVAMSLPILSGYIWDVYGFRWVFILASAIAFAGFFVCLQIKVPQRNLA